MKAANTSKRHFERTKLLFIGSNRQVSHLKVKGLVNLLGPGDILVLNKSGTLPASFRGILERTGEPVEIRLASFLGPTLWDLAIWKAVALGSGDWTLPTEERGPPPKIVENDCIRISPQLHLVVQKVTKLGILDIQFKVDACSQESLISLLYRLGKPIQYSYLTEELEVWDQQNIFSGPPISVEPPSASLNFSWSTLSELQQKGVHVVGIYHGAGISSTGSQERDAQLPLKEWYKIPRQTAEIINEGRASGKNIIALGTSTLRALEASFDPFAKRTQPGQGLTDLVIGPSHNIQSANAIITGMHELGTSHRKILNQFCDTKSVQQAFAVARKRGYKNHEYGDLSLLGCKLK